ncbi:MAG: glycosyltransferase [Chloroflexi bacterium]|nr:glycosyltransferase [Chloroflexota bacterium]
MVNVSVIIPAYNSARYIGESINSVLEQTFGDFEIVVVDDGSVDATTEMATASGDPRIRVIRKPNGGTASARNVGIQNSTGTYLQFLDADDIILPGKLTTQVRLLETHPTVDIVYSSFRCFQDDQCELHPPDWLRPPSRDPYRELVSGSAFPLHAALARRDSVESVGMFDSELISAEDWDLWIRLARAGHGFMYHEDLYALYRQHASSKTRRRARWRHAHVLVMENLRRLAEGEEELQRVNWYIHASRNYVLWALALLADGEHALSREAFREAYSLNTHLGYSQETLARRIAEYARAIEKDSSGQSAVVGARWLDAVQSCLPGEYPGKAVIRTSRALYWLGKAHQAHLLGVRRAVRGYLWNAVGCHGIRYMNCGTISALLQSVIGPSNWMRMKRLWKR